MASGNWQSAAEHLGISTTTLWRRMKRGPGLLRCRTLRLSRRHLVIGVDAAAVPSGCCPEPLKRRQAEDSPADRVQLLHYLSR
ncbi:helix-turn-helix domain-containing protein [Pseudomonas sp. MEJ086]|uniref:helix-turn-helix domain-containing protein n=1 Tax=Pseudomonas TaxID=286 RepID=UPI0018CE24FD